MTHEIFMEKAIELAQKGKWHTAPNPCVGAVLTYKDAIIAEGYHTQYGQAHAEIECLLDAIEKGFFDNIDIHFSNPLLSKACEKKRDFKNISSKNTVDFSNNASPYTLADCTLYVTLEPCNHAGKTPPCSKAIVESGIKHVVIGMLDPNPKAAGGIGFLEKNDIKVEVGILEKDCKDLLADFLIWQQQKRPYVILKMACSLDGRIGPNYGDNHRISGTESHDVLMQLRENIGNAGGAILVGANTFFKDNPKLTARTKTATKQPYAAIISSKLPPLSPLNKSKFTCIEERAQETFFYCSKGQAISPTAINLENKGLRIKGISPNTNGNGLNIKEVLEDLFLEKSCHYVLCEGGARLGLNLLKTAFVDELILYMAPMIMGDETAKPVFIGNIMHTMNDALRYTIKNTVLVGSDLHIHLKPEPICLQD